MSRTPCVRKIQRGPLYKLADGVAFWLASGPTTGAPLVKVAGGYLAGWPTSGAGWGHPTVTAVSSGARVVRAPEALTGHIQ